MQVVDDKGCIGDTSDVLIKVRPELGLEIPKVDTICPYDTIDVSVEGTGGDSIYTFSWETGQFGNTITISPDEPRWYTITVCRRLRHTQLRRQRLRAGGWVFAPSMSH